MGLEVLEGSDGDRRAHDAAHRRTNNLGTLDNERASETCECKGVACTAELCHAIAGLRRLGLTPNSSASAARTAFYISLQHDFRSSAISANLRELDMDLCTSRFGTRGLAAEARVHLACYSRASRAMAIPCVIMNKTLAGGSPVTTDLVPSAIQAFPPTSPTSSATVGATLHKRLG